MNDPIQHNRNWKHSTVAQKVHNVHTSVTTESVQITIRPIRRGSSGTDTEMQQLMGTVGKYIHVPKNAKFTQEKQNGNRLRRDITPI